MLEDIFKPGLPMSTAVDKPDYIKPLSGQQMLCNFRELYHREDPYSWPLQLSQTRLLLVHQREGDDPGFVRRYEKMALLGEVFAMFSREWQLSLIDSLHNGLACLRLTDLDSHFTALRQLCGKQASQGVLYLRHGKKLSDELVLQALYHLLDVDTPQHWVKDLDEVLFDLSMSEEKTERIESLQIQVKSLRDFFGELDKELAAVIQNEPEQRT